MTNNPAEIGRVARRRGPTYLRIAIFILLGLIWGSEWMVTRSIDFPLFLSLAIRYALACCTLAGVALAKRPWPSLRDVGVAAVTGVMLLAGPPILIFWASSHVSPSLLVVMLALTPLMAALFEGKAHGRTLAALTGGVAGTAFLASQGLSFATSQWQGAAAAGAAALLIAASVVGVKRSLPRMHPVILASIQLGAASIFMAIASLAIEGRPAPLFTWEFAAHQLSLAIFGDALAFPLYYWLLRQVESFQLTASQWVVTIIGVIEGFLLEHEFVSWHIVMGMGIAAVSLVELWKIEPGDTEVTISPTLPSSKW